jgi:hypothetical protein
MPFSLLAMTPYPKAAVLAAAVLGSSVAIPILGAAGEIPAYADSWLQYGALGLCAIMVLIRAWEGRAWANTLREKDRHLERVAEQFRKSTEMFQSIVARVLVLEMQTARYESEGQGHRRTTPREPGSPG